MIFGNTIHGSLFTIFLTIYVWFYAHYIVRSLSHTIFWDILIFLDHLLSIRSLYRTIFCLYGHYTVRALSHTIFWHAIIFFDDLLRIRSIVHTIIIPYDLYPIRSFGIRSFSLTIFCEYDLLSIRSLYRMIFILYDLLAYDQFPTIFCLTIFCDTIFCPVTGCAVCYGLCGLCSARPTKRGMTADRESPSIAYVRTSHISRLTRARWAIHYSAIPAPLGGGQILSPCQLPNRWS